MALYKSAQYNDAHTHSHEDVEIEDIGDQDQVILYQDKPTEEEVLEMHHDAEQEPAHLVEAPLELVFKLPSLPGSDVVEDVETDCEVEVDGDEKPADKNDISEGTKSKDVEDTDPWTSWKKNGPKHTVNWAKEMLGYIPRHTGKEVSGVERAIAFLERLLKELSSAIRGDLNGDIEIEEFEQVRKEIVSGIDRLEEHAKSFSGKKKAADHYDHALVKLAQRAAYTGGMTVMVPLLISTIARTAINSTVSAGKDIEKVVPLLIKKYSLSDREVAELLQHLADCNFPIRRPRGYNLDEHIDSTSVDNFDWAQNTGA